MIRLFFTVAMLFLLIGNFTITFAAPVVTVSFQDGVNGYTGTQDTKLMSRDPTTNFGPAVKMEIDGSPDRSSLLYWDLTSIPPGSVIQSADIMLNISNTSSQSYEFYQLLQPWIENEATWNEYASGQSWQVAGADSSGDRGSTVLGYITAPSKGFVTISLNSEGVAVVQSWVDNPSSNYGFIVQDYINASNGLDFYSRETGTVTDRPKITVTYDSNSQPVLTIDDVTFTEGNVGETDVIFTISLSFADSDPVTVDYYTEDGSATSADNDYAASSGQIYFQPGETSQLVTVVVNGDTIEEPNETFIVNLSNASNAAIGDNQGIGNILDDDRPLAPDIAATPSSHDYGDVAIGSSSSKVFVISNEGTENLNVNSTSLIGSDVGEFSILNGGEPFTLAPGSIHSIDVSFVPVSEGTKNAVLELSSDDLDEGLFDINLSGNGVLMSMPGEPVTFSVTGDYPDFGEMGIFEQHIIQHNLYSPSEFFVHVGDILDQGDSCQEASYQSVADRLKTLAVSSFVVIGDNDWIDCPDQAQAFQWWFDQFAYFEKNFCGSPVVERQNIRPENWAFVMKGVLFAGINNPGTSADGEDRNIRLQDDADWVDFQLLDKAEQIRAAVVFGHSGPSSSEALFFDQFKASSITFAKPVFYIQGHKHHWQLDNPWPDAPNMQRLIVPRGADEDPPQVTVTMDPNNPFEIIREPWKNNPPLFNREPCVDAGSDQMISQLETLDLNGVATDDGVPTNPGSLSTTWSKVSGPGDVVFGDENALSTTANFTSGGIYELRLTAFDGELASSDELIIEIQDSGPVLSINDVGIDEGDSGTADAILTVTLSEASSETVTVDYATADGSAIAGSDYAAVSGQVSFQPGETTQPIVVAVNGDTLTETNETFFVNLSNAVNATITDFQGTGIIIDNDSLLTLSINDVVVTEGNNGTADAVFTVMLSSTSSQPVTVDYATADLTATAGSDYVAVSGQLSFQPGQTSQSVTVAVMGDLSDEPDETFAVNLSNAINANIIDNQGTGTITDDDVTPLLSIDDVAVTEGNGGTVDAVFTVTMSGISSQTVTVNYATVDGSANAGSDYVAVSGQLSFQPGETSRAVTVLINGDILLEPDETFVVNLSNGVNGNIGDGQGIGTITNDDVSGGQRITVSFQDGVGGYTGTRDTKLMSRDPNTNFGTATKLEIDGSPDRSALLYWDLASIPPGSIVDSVDITVNITNGTTHNYECYQLLQPWIENEATWNQYAFGRSWQVAGADGSSDRGSTGFGVISGGKGLATISLNAAGIAMVQAWVDDPSSNHGFIILNYISARNGLDFSSRETGTVSKRPKLTVTYSVGSL